MECPGGNVCKGGFHADFRSIDFYRGECDEGYTGPLCNSCIDGYGKSDETTCG